MDEIMDPFSILPDIETQLREYIICPEKLPIHNYERNQEFWRREPNIISLFHHDLSPLSTTLKVQRDAVTGEIITFIEVPIQSAGATAQNSMSLNREPGALSDDVRGNTLNIPFLPGSFSDPVENLPQIEENNELLRVAPGLSGGLVFEADRFTVKGDTNNVETEEEDYIENCTTVNLLDLIDDEELFATNKNEEPKEESEITQHINIPEEDEVIPKDFVLNISSLNKKNTMVGTKYVIPLDCTKDVPDFHERIPEMAHKYPFELDTFQKLAILQLEQHNHVFVAAHTSAGKTVVAEYAIALSQKHMTRSIYTSPIKALSNQKYRDFQNTFKDVGLITGDFQINQNASCLIMTTEILRSMLYCGSEVIRDLEYVIFDEVHYINDKERGHVWEQVLIMLPAEVCVVLLSATVPNSIEFADWLGRTHKKKVYVVSTTQRPVPLEHYLYTGVGGSTANNRFMVLNSNGWIPLGYKKACETSPESGYFHVKQEKTLWYTLVDHLKRNSLLPVVAFTFSRAKCDNNSKMLSSLDLTTKTEKGLIHRFFMESIRTLKEPDREIPQIVSIGEILKRGIGVHHSGILPIIKEIIEILFQNGLIKLLFATETFAMGVNMPARCVIFDSITKHDGKERRELLPAEYIQMAGRAGRRGKDSKGTVIILCKGKAPAAQTLQNMMMGKPSQLESQFRITYSMVLSVLRVERLSVEGMMSRSFGEADHQKCMDGWRKELIEVEKKLKDNFSEELKSHLDPLITFYERASDFLKERESEFPGLILSQKPTSELKPGRVVLVTHKHHINKLGILLSTPKRAINAVYKVLVLTDTSDKFEHKEDDWFKMVSLATESFYTPLENVNHEVLNILPQDIFEISSSQLKISEDNVLQDWDKRQIPRFSSDPPGKSCQAAINELTNLITNINNGYKLKYLDFIKDLNMNDSIFFFKIKKLNDLKMKVTEQMNSVCIPSFREQFDLVYRKKVLEDRRDYLKHNLSDSSMLQYPEYDKRIRLLMDLKYIDNQKRVELKGRVACEVGMNELMVTELVLRNVLKHLEPEEVAALLSGLVFQVRIEPIENSSFEESQQLKLAKFKLQEIYTEIKDLESKYQISDAIDMSLNFGLIEVVFHWARNEPFSEIMKFTKVQEGIIVRCIQQLNEIICDVKNAARIIGDPELQSKMEEASNAIKRDIVFAASLYTQKIKHISS